MVRLPPPPDCPFARPRRRAWACAAGLALLVAAAPLPAAGSQDGSQAQARARLQRAEYVSLAKLITDALQRHPGHVVEVELEDGDEYEIEILRRDGVVVELHYDARTGRLLKTEIEDD